MIVGPPCAGNCGRQVDVAAKLVMFEVRGWAEKRTGGGLHHIFAREETGRLLCPRCARSLKDTGNPGQGRML